ncbi:DUF3027 domain-containing protein [Bifidobacterium sp. 64T4]|nr:DUF3027 domain-containing protein [Bifidobacterium pongonis]
MTGTDEVLDPQTPSEQPDPRDIARAVAMDAADAPEQVGEVVDAIELGDNVTDFRLAAAVRGYEGWQWSVTLYHDTEVGTWTVNESSLVPTDDALMPPAWIPWKDRLEPTDLAPTDSIGTDPDDPRLEDGFRRTEPVQASGDAEAGSADAAVSTNVDKPEQAGESADGDAEANAENAESAENVENTENATNVDVPAGTDESTNVDKATEEAATAEASSEASNEADATAETDEIVEEFALSRRHVLSPQGRAQVAKRWYEGPRGPKALSTKTADGNLCSTCGFFVPLKGELNLMFGVCANKWSPDDGRVVSVDHGCGEHSEIEPPEPSHLWVQSKPAYDDFHIDVIAQKPRDERGVVEAIEQLDDDEQNDEATEEDILANTEPDDGDDEANETQPSGVDATAELEAVVDIAAAGDDEADDESDDSLVDGADDSTDEAVDDRADGTVDDNSVDEPVDGETEGEPVDSASEGETDAVAVDSTDEVSVDETVEVSVDENADGSVDESAEVTVDESVDEPVGEAAEPEADLEPEPEASLDPVPSAEQLELIEEATETIVEVAVEEPAEEAAEEPAEEPADEPAEESEPEPSADPEPDQEGSAEV